MPWHPVSQTQWPNHSEIFYCCSHVETVDNGEGLELCFAVFVVWAARYTCDNVILARGAVISIPSLSGFMIQASATCFIFYSQCNRGNNEPCDIANSTECRLNVCYIADNLIFFSAVLYAMWCVRTSYTLLVAISTGYCSVWQVGTIYGLCFRCEINISSKTHTHITQKNRYPKTSECCCNKCHFADSL